MIQNIGYIPTIPIKKNMANGFSSPILVPPNSNISTQSPVLFQPPVLFNTALSTSDTKKYNYLIGYLSGIQKTQNALNMSCANQLDYLLKTGKLLSSKSNTSETTLDSLYKIATTPRVNGLDAKNLISSTLDILVNPRIITQNFGDIPNELKPKILSILNNDEQVKKDPSLMNVTASGTCAAASIEVNLADKYPAEFARWVEGLSSEKKAVYLDLPLSSLSKNKLEATQILNLMQAQKTSIDLNKARIKIEPDKNAYIRAGIQNKYWDYGERTVPDVLMQSAIMQLGSQNTYDSLCDVREKGELSSSPQGLVEIEKTFVESLIKNKEITSLVYQKVDENQNLVGYSCSFDKMQKHIIDTLNSGEDVIIGCTLTNETAGKTASPGYNRAIDGAPNKIINGHEITIVGYENDANGNLVFICVDTDDDNPEFVKYSASYLLPTIHHAGYPAYIVEADEKEIMDQIFGV